MLRFFKIQFPSAIFIFYFVQLMSIIQVTIKTRNGLPTEGPFKKKKTCYVLLKPNISSFDSIQKFNLKSYKNGLGLNLGLNIVWNFA